MRPIALTAIAGLLLAATGLPALAQSTGYVTGFPGKDPAGDDEIGWGPAYRPETSFSQPGTPPTPGDFAGAAYRARTGHGPYDAIQDTRGDRGVAFVPDEPRRALGKRNVRSQRLDRTHKRHAARRSPVRPASLR